jgi:GTP-binding protein
VAGACAAGAGLKILSAQIVATAAGPEGFPSGDLPEVAFLGRSNVGKSSLLNRLVARKRLARTSRTPGKTRLLHFYQVERPGRELLLVDLPGYGYARTSKSERASWQGLIEGYLERREALRAAVLLQDLRRDPSEDETLLLGWLCERKIPSLVALTKIDKLKPVKRAARLRDLSGSLPVQADWLIPTSARTGAGIEQLWRVIDTLL